MLAGVRVVELAGSTSGAYCGRLLAAAGATTLVLETRATAVADGALRRFLHAGKASLLVDELTDGEELRDGEELTDGEELAHRRIREAQILVCPASSPAVTQSRDGSRSERTIVVTG